MNTASSPDGNHHNSSSVNQHYKQLTVPILTNGLDPDQHKSAKPPSGGEKVPNVGQHDIDNTNLAKLYESSNTVVSVEHSKQSTCDLTMSPVEGPINDLPKTNVVLRDGEKSGEGCEQFAGQIVYNPDGSAYILEENDETLLEQIPTQEGAIVERAGKAVSQVEYPKIDQAFYIARRKAWYNAFGSAYLQLMQGKRPESPNIHNFKVVSVRDKINSRRTRHEEKCTDEMSRPPTGRVQTINF